LEVGTEAGREDGRRKVGRKRGRGVVSLHSERESVGKEAAVLEHREQVAWQQFNDALINGAAKKR
jgi:hypothetical protein